MNLGAISRVIFLAVPNRDDSPGRTFSLKKRIFLAAASLSLLVAVAVAAQDAVKIAWTPKVGFTQNYTLKFTGTGLNIPGMTGDLSVTGTVVHKINEIKSDGHIIVEEKQSDVVIKIGDQEMPNPGAKVITETYTYLPTGEIIESKSDSTEGDQNARLEESNAFVFPANPVKVGDTWKRTGKANSARGIFDNESTYTYQGTDTVDGVACYKIGVDFKETGAPTNMTGTGTFWINTADGELAKAEESLKNVELPGLPNPFNAMVSLTRK